MFSFFCFADGWIMMLIVVGSIFILYMLCTVHFAIFPFLSCFFSQEFFSASMAFYDTLDPFLPLLPHFDFHRFCGCYIIFRPSVFFFSLGFLILDAREKQNAACIANLVFVSPFTGGLLCLFSHLSFTICE